MHAGMRGSTRLHIGTHKDDDKINPETVT